MQHKLIDSSKLYGVQCAQCHSMCERSGNRSGAGRKSSEQEWSVELTSQITDGSAER